jgi:hypothetical protein
MFDINDIFHFILSCMFDVNDFFSFCQVIINLL